MKGLITFNHPGGKNVVLPVVSFLLNQHPDLQLDFAITSESSGLEEEFKERVHAYCLPENVSSEDLRSLDWNQYQFVLSGTSISGNLEKTVVREATRLKIKSYSIVDHWCNYLFRYEEKEGSFDSVPDIIFVPDDLAKVEMESFGFDQSKIISSGHPGLGSLEKKIHKLTSEDKNRIHKNLKLESGWEFAVFVSEPISQDEHSDSEIDERTVIQDFLIQQLSWLTQNRIQLFIKLHPRDDQKKYSDLPIEVIPTHLDKFEIIQSARFVIGIDSMLLLESSLLNVPTFSLCSLVSGKLSIGERLSWVKSFHPDQREKLLSLNDVSSVEILLHSNSCKLIGDKILSEFIPA
ncbi:polysialyltransferase family glycosyltransferase [Leptospira idonii]|uniref:CDP-glycerol--glycerophosphate glycerophosphotransferase n=1 Tax=Leptospira idonii TaxID=1193500 RepID=A0A4R9LVI0_9LEPT|nr:hypothetical protein [Leptospira idonii]TGN18253.1 hypothetical protein EHS15_12645 [Leptospira idonii]